MREVKKRKEPKGLVPIASREDFRDPLRRFRKEASTLTKNIPGLDAEEMASEMERIGGRYALTMFKHWEGSSRVVMESVFKVSRTADALIQALNALGPRGQAIALGKEVDLIQFVLYEEGEWLWNLVEKGQRMKVELEDTPWAGRPMGETGFKKEARTILLQRSWEFLKFTLEPDSNKASELVPKMARAIHRVLIEPELPPGSQLFEKEWDKMKKVQK